MFEIHSVPPLPPSPSPSLCCNDRPATRCVSVSRSSCSFARLYWSKSQSSDASPSSSSWNHSGLYWNYREESGNGRNAGTLRRSYQISSTHTTALASSVLEVLCLPHCLLLCLFLVHTRLLPYRKSFPSHWRKIGTQFVSLEARQSEMNVLDQR